MNNHKIDITPARPIWDRLIFKIRNDKDNHYKSYSIEKIISKHWEQMYANKYHILDKIVK